MPVRGIASPLRRALLQFNEAAKREMHQALLVTGEVLLDMHREAVSDWSTDHRPHFQRRVNISRDALTLVVSPRGKGRRVYLFVDRGTKPHWIPKFGPTPPGKPLRFRTGYEAKTKPIAKFRQGRGIATGPWVSARRVWHPGTEARQFSKTYHDDITPEFRRQIENGFRRLTRKYS